MPLWLAARDYLPSPPEEGAYAETHVYRVCCCPQVALCTVRGPLCEDLWRCRSGERCWL